MVGVCVHCKQEFKKREAKRKFCSLFCSSRYNRNNLKKIEYPHYSKTLAEFVGILLGDGYVSRYQVGISLNSIADAQYIPYVTNLARTLFPPVSISITKRKTDHATDIRLNSTLVASFFREMGIIPHAKVVPRWIICDKSYAVACVKGLFDTEGSISFKTYRTRDGLSLYKQLNFRGIDRPMMKFVRDTLISLGLKPTLSLQKSLYLSNNTAIKKYKDVVGFGNPKLLNRSTILTYQEYIMLKRHSLTSRGKNV